MREALIATGLVIAILIGAGAGYLLGAENQRTVTSTATLISASTTSEFNGTSSASQACISNISSTQYVSMLRQIMTMPSFIQYSNGRCWTFESTFWLSGPGDSNLTIVLDHFSNTIWYPCGLLSFKADARVYIVPSYSAGQITGISITPQNPPTGTSCGHSPENTLLSLSFNFISWDPSGQKVSLTLLYVPSSNTNASLRSLQARIFNSTLSYLIPFSNVNSTNPLLAGSYSKQTMVIPGYPLRPGVVYSLSSTGTYLNGTRLISSCKVELQT